MVQNYIGAPILRKEDRRFLMGRARFTDDVKLPHMLHAAIIRSPHAHALIKSIDASEALEIPGVVAVYSAADVEAVLEPKRIPLRTSALEGLDRFLQYPFARGKVRYVGDPVAVVVAESRHLAEDAIDVVKVEYEPLPVVTDVIESYEGKVLLHEEHGTNVAADQTVSVGDVEEAFRNAEYTRQEEFHIPRYTANPLETRGLVASYDPGRHELTCWGETKVPYFNRGVLSSMLDMPTHALHFFEPDVGGGFGARGEFYPEDFMIPFASKMLGRPVKWIEDRREHLVSCNHSRDQTCRLEIAAKRDGTITAMRAAVYGNNGGYVRTHGGVVPLLTATLIPGPYRVPNYEGRILCVVTNKTGVGTLRGPGMYEAAFSRERLIDMMAQDLGIDPVEIRFKNLVLASEMPYDTGIIRPPENPPTIYDSGDFPQAFQVALDALDYDNLKEQQGKLIDGKYHGIGIGSFVEFTAGGAPYEAAKVAVTAPDQVVVYMGISTLGQGHETTMAQVCAQGLGVPYDYVTLHGGNTDLMPHGGGTNASRQAVMGGSAVFLAAQELQQKILRIAAGYLDVDPEELELEMGHLYRKASRVEGALMDIGRVLELASPTSQYNQGEVGLEATHYFRSTMLPHSYGSHVAHITVDPETGKIDILRYVMADDVGHIINPIVARGQLVGGAAQGIGATILEELAYDDNGQPLCTTYMDFLTAASTEVPDLEVIELDLAPSPHNPLGVKGVGESGIVATGAVLANAVSNALSSLGVQVRDMPLSPSYIRDLIREAKGTQDMTLSPFQRY